MPKMAVAVSMCLGLLLSISPFVAGAQPARPDGASKVDSVLRRQLAATSETSFWVLLRESADLSRARTMGAKANRGTFVIDQLKQTADRSQAGLRATLTQRGVNFESYWIANSLRVTGGASLIDELAAHPEVAQIVADVPVQLPTPIPAADPTPSAVEWGVARVRAPEVWSTFLNRGEGIVVANIDTGVLFAHPALVNQYHGFDPITLTFDHNYNWYDPSSVCLLPEPCDNNNHGTHTMGTMVGDDGGANQIGVAPGATWIAAKGCEGSSCSRAALLASGQWILAPRDLNDLNADPTRAPHVVNNSWGLANSSDPWYSSTVAAWVAAGIFPTFSNGNSGPGCGTVGVPGSYPESYGVGAFDINNNIAGFSSRGPSPFGFIKPDVSAPGVGVRSSVTGGVYASFSGTSMAAPHVSGVVALMWSQSPILRGDVASTRNLINSTAINVSNLSCGGTPTNNNVWGNGRIDAFAAVSAAP
jgi:subtilisin family serine protease